MPIYKSNIIILLLMLLITSHASGEKPKQLNNIVIISIDALHPDALLRSKVPMLLDLMHKGSYTLDGRSTEPPKTLVAHTALFTGLSPAENGKTDNHWATGQTAVRKKTIFDSARAYGFNTGFFYSKEKLGYLINDAVDMHHWSPDSAVDEAEAFIKSLGRHFLFLHVSGLDQVGPQYGWLSPDYLEELSFIDDYLSSLTQYIFAKEKYVLIITSDHAGHGKIHGSDHPEDYRLPLVICSDTVEVKQFQNISYSVTELKKIIETMLQGPS